MPDDWPQFTRRATRAGITPKTYALLGTALLAHRAREDRRSLAAAEPPAPPLTEIEVRHEFPALLDSGLTPLRAVAQIARAVAARLRY